MARALPAANVLLADPGIEGYALDTGFDLLDVPSFRLKRKRRLEGAAREDWEYQVSTRVYETGFVQESILNCDDINTVCQRPRMVHTDTPLSEYNQFGGAWAEALPLLPPRAQRIVQYSTEKDTVFRLESQYFLPENPLIAFSVHRLPSKVDHNETNYPSKIQVVIGGEWQVRFARGDDAGIWQKIDGEWYLREHLSIQATTETFVWFMVRRGCVCFSFDLGESWKWYKQQSRLGPVEPIVVPESQLFIECTSGKFSFGFHQLVLDDAWIESYDIPTLEHHWGTPYNEIYGEVPAGASLEISYLSSPPATVRYRVDFHADDRIVPNLSFPVYYGPELYANFINWPTILAAPAGGYEDLTALGIVTGIDVDEDIELKTRSGNVEIDWHPNSSLTGTYGWRLVDIDLGYLLHDGSYSVTNRGIFYLIEPSIDIRRDWNGSLPFELVDLYQRAVETKVDIGWRPLDGMTCLEARNYIMFKMGLNPSLRADFLDTGNVLSNGLPDNPFWQPTSGTTAAELFDALDFYEWVDTFVASDGTWTSQPKGYYDAVSSFTFCGIGSTGEEYRLKDGRLRESHKETATAFIASSKDERFGTRWGTSFRYDLERNPSAPGFVGFRRWKEIDLRNGATLAQIQTVLARAQIENMDVPYVLEGTVPGLHGLFRGMQITVINAEGLGVNDDNRWRVRGLAHKWRPTKSQTETTIRASRII